uniref:E3 ubiquitin-protein ligase rnf168 isoform X2 n=1 Tax=Scatophagus argus TaxID=75038 RepID=UPI001ED803AB|nr:E3 ubiquitin-protein ligase rnf168 isoform X2 [Scatophagus argus]
MASVSEVEASDRGGRGRRGPLSLEDCCCPVCLEIFMEPVTLPCTHTFCKVCFLESVDKSTLCCPLCRKRVSTWARQNSRNNTLVNKQLWTQIQTSFPLQCQRRLSGQDVITTDGPAVFFPRVSQPGELRQEYEDQVTKLTEEKRVLDEEERRASEEYIQRLLAEEEELLQEERRRREDDERLARLLSDQLNSAAVSQGNLRPADVTPAKKKKEVISGQIERFLCPRPSKSSSSACSLTANKENILISLQAERPPPQLDYYGDTSEDPDLHPTSLSASEEDRPQLSRDGGPSSAKRKSSELETTVGEEAAVTKRACHSPSSSSSSDLEGGGSVLQGTTEIMELQSRRQQQEEEDWRLALLLQKELDQEERQRATNRSKGSSDAYLLRQNRKVTAEASSSDTPSRTSRKTPKTPSSSSSSPSSASGKTPKASTPSCVASVKTPKTPSSSSSSSSSSSVKTTQTSTPSSSSRGSKQATLTEMFTCLSS